MQVVLVQTIQEEHIECCILNVGLQELLGYARWENFITVILRAVESCKSIGFNPEDHFRGVTKMVILGSGAERQIEDFMKLK